MVGVYTAAARHSVVFPCRGTEEEEGAGARNESEDAVEPPEDARTTQTRTGDHVTTSKEPRVLQPLVVRACVSHRVVCCTIPPLEVTTIQWRIQYIVLVIAIIYFEVLTIQYNIIILWCIDIVARLPRLLQYSSSIVEKGTDNSLATSTSTSTVVAQYCTCT